MVVVDGFNRVEDCKIELNYTRVVLSWVPSVCSCNYIPCSNETWEDDLHIILNGSVFLIMDYYECLEHCIRVRIQIVACMSKFFIG